MSDWQILRDYVDRGSDAAFEQLVKRHVDMVYGTAMRLVSDPHTAQDITQAVFILLAQKARGLSSSVVLGGWLYRTTTLVAKRALRTQFRQQRREQEAFLAPENDATDEKWQELAPHLDAALTDLAAADRTAVIMRFLQQRSFREVAEALKVSEDAAKKRVSRAIEKLKQSLTARGVGVASTAALATLLTTQSALAAPNSVINAVLATELSAGATQGATALAAGVSRVWLVQKLSWVLVPLVVGLLVLLIPRERETDVAAQQAPAPSVKRAMARTGASHSSPKGEVSTNSLFGSKRIDFKVVSSVNGSPLQGASLHLFVDSTRKISKDFVTDNEGRAQIDVSEGWFYGMYVWASAPGHTPKVIRWGLGETPPSSYTATLKTAIRVSGTVVNEQQQPIAGASLHFQGTGFLWNSRESVDYQYSKVISNERGEWVADFLDATQQMIAGRVLHPDYAETNFAVKVLPGGTGNVITLPSGARVEGMVVSTSGEPIKEAKVVADWEHMWRSEYPLKTDENGRFAWAHFPPGNFHLTVSAEGFSSMEQWVALQSSRTNLQIALPRVELAGNSTLRLRLVDGRGEPLRQVHVRLSAEQKFGPLNWSATTDEEGRLVWNSAPTNSVSLDLRLRYFDPLTNVVVATDGSEHTIAMVPAKTIELRGRVTDKHTGKPLESFTVFSANAINLPDGRKELVDVHFFGEGRNGEFRFTLFPPRHDGNVAALALQIAAKSYLEEVVYMQSLDADQEFSIALTPTDDFAGVVFDTNRQPVPGATVCLVGGKLQADMQEPGRFLQYSSSNIRSTVTDLNGRFSLAPTAGATGVAIAHKSGWALVRKASTGKEKAIHLQPWARIEGRLLVAGKPDAGVTVGAESEGWSSHNSSTDAMRFIYTAKTDNSGNFHFDKVPAGKVTVYKRTDQNPGGTGLVVKNQTTNIVVRAGATERVELGGKGLIVRGRFITEPQRSDLAWTAASQTLRPIRLGSGELKDADGHGFFCKADGTFEVEDVPPGDYILEAHVMAAKDKLDPELLFKASSIGNVTNAVTVPETESNEFDLGTVVIPAKEP